jgi:anaerobic magnesium-protoporphyrin IX monomethyl ester cyclase
MMGCLKAFAKSGFQRTFYDLGRVGYWGPQTKKTVDFGFDAARQSAPPEREAIAEADAAWVTMHGPKIEMKRRKGEELAAAALAKMAASACGGGKDQLDESDYADLEMAEKSRHAEERAAERAAAPSAVGGR